MGWLAERVKKEKRNLHCIPFGRAQFLKSNGTMAIYVLYFPFWKISMNMAACLLINLIIIYVMLLSVGRWTMICQA